MEVAKGIVRAQLWTGGFYWIETKGTIASREQAPILVGNHTCFMDPVYLFSNIAAPAVRIESKNVPLAGLVFRAVGALWIDRGAEKKKAKQEAEKKKANKGQQSRGNGKAESGSSEPDKAGVSSSSEGEEQPSKPVTITEKIIARASDPRPGVTRLMIFPEGTCGNGLALQSFKYGAFLPMKPVQPVVMQYRYRYFDPSWVNDGPRGLPLTIRMLLSVFNTMTVQYLPVVDPKKELPESQQTPYAFGDLVQRKMAEAMGVPISHVSFLDVSMGMDCQDTCKRAKKALRQAKKGKGPSVQELESAARLSLDADPVLRKGYPVHLTNGEVKQVTDRIMGHRVDRTPLGRAVRLLMALDEDRAGYVGMDRFVSFFLEEDKVPALQPLPEGAGDGEEEEEGDEDRVSEEQVRALCDACLAGGEGEGEGEGEGGVPELSTEGRRAALEALFRGFSAPASKGQWPEGLPRVGKEDGLPIFALPPFEVEPERLRRGAGVAGSGSEGAGAAGGAAGGEAGQKEGGKKQAPAGPGGEELRYVSIRELVVLWAVLHAGLSSGADQSAGALEMQAKASSAAARGLRCCMEACGVLLQALPEEDRAVVLGGQGGALPVAGRYQVGGPLPTGPWGRAVSRRLRQLVLGARFDTMSLPRPQRKSKKDKKEE